MLKSRSLIIYERYNKYFRRSIHCCRKEGNRNKINTIMLQFKKLIWKILSKTACPKDLLNWTGLEVVYHTKTSESKNTINHFFLAWVGKSFHWTHRNFPLTPCSAVIAAWKRENNSNPKLKFSSPHFITFLAIKGLKKNTKLSLL